MAKDTDSPTAIAQGNWKNALCSCYETPMLCVNAMFCFPCVMAQTRGKLGNYICFKNFKMFLGFLILLYVALLVVVAIYNVLQQVIVYEYLQASKDGDGSKMKTKLGEIKTLSDTWSVPMSIAGLLFAVIIMKTRMDVRVKKNMPADACNDCLTSCFCTICTVVQSAREVDVSEECCNMKEPEAGLDKV